MNALHNPGLPASLTLGGVSLSGFAISALASYVVVPSYDIVFDLGHVSLDVLPVKNVLLSHVHKDHIAGLPLYLSLRDMQKMGRANVYVPMESREGVLRFLAAFDAMEGPEVADRSREVIGLCPDQTIKVGRHLVRVFAAHHRAPSLGYTVVDQRSKLKAEFVGMDGTEIAALRKTGVEVQDTVLRDMVTYVGDSTIQTLQEHPELGKSQVLIIEATHLPGTPLEAATKFGHTHLDELVELYRQDPNGALAAPHIVLKHFSMKYSEDQIREAVRGLPEGLRERVSVLIPS